MEGVIRLVVVDHTSAIERDRGSIWKTEQNADANRISSAHALSAVCAANCLIVADRGAGEGHG